MAQTDIDYLKKLNVVYEIADIDEIYNDVEDVISAFLTADPNMVFNGNYSKNTYSFFFNYIRYIIKEERLNPNTLLSIAIKHTYNYIGLYLIGMLVRAGGNPNVYLQTREFGTIHILALAAVRNRGPDPYFRYIIALLRMLGSDINYPTYQYNRNDNLIDVTFIESLSDNNYADTSSRIEQNNVLVKDFVRAYDKIPDENLELLMNSLELPDLKKFLIAADDYEKIRQILDTDYMSFVTSNQEQTASFLTDASTAYSNSIISNINEKDFPQLDTWYNAQKLPLFVASTSLNKEMFDIFTLRGFHIKYLTINTLVSYFKVYQKKRVRLYRNAYLMLIDAIDVGAYMDRYQFNEVMVTGSYEEISNIEKSYAKPEWQKLCNIKAKKPRQELVQLAFDLGLDYNMNEEKICDKLNRISLMDKDEFLRAAIERQEDRINADLSSSDDYAKGATKDRYRCNLKTTVLKNPYAYNDARMAFYKSPKDGEVYCFTSDLFSDLVTSKINPYNEEKLPVKFLNTIRTQINILNELGVYKTNTSVEDAIKEILTDSQIDNKKTDYSYNTVISALELNGVSKDLFDSLNSYVQKDVILGEICGVNVSHFESLTPAHRIKTVARVIYSLSKDKENPNPNVIFELIARAIGGGQLIEEEPEKDILGDLMS